MAEKLVTIKHLKGPVFQATLYHDLVCAHRQVCTCKPLPPRGKEPPRREEASIILPPGMESVPLPAAILRIPQVLAAQQAGLIRVVACDAKIEEV
jgi:hypothetical protein